MPAQGTWTGPGSKPWSVLPLGGPGRSHQASATYTEDGQWAVMRERVPEAGRSSSLIKEENAHDVAG